MTLCSLLVAGMARGGMTWPTVLVLGLTLSVCVQIVYAPEALLVMTAVFSGGAAVWVTKKIIDAATVRAMQPHGVPVDPALHCKTCSKLVKLRAAADCAPQSSAAPKEALGDAPAPRDDTRVPSAEEYACAAQTQMFIDSAPVDCDTPERENDADDSHAQTPVQYHWAAYLPPSDSPARRPQPSVAAATAPEDETDLLSVD